MTMDSGRLWYTEDDPTHGTHYHSISSILYSGRTAFHDVLLIDTETGDMLDAIIGGNQTTGLEVSDDGTLLAFSDLLDDRVAVYSVPTTEELLGGGGGRYQDHLTELAK